MIRWDPNGEQIIVERPEQLALHVLPSIYRQSRFASFSRQLNVSRYHLEITIGASEADIEPEWALFSLTDLWFHAQGQFAQCGPCH